MSLKPLLVLYDDIRCRPFKIIPSIYPTIPTDMGCLIAVYDQLYSASQLRDFSNKSLIPPPNCPCFDTRFSISFHRHCT